MMTKKYMYFDLIAQRGHQLFDPQTALIRLSSECGNLAYTAHLGRDPH
jgi:hypothetical protein